MKRLIVLVFAILASAIILFAQNNPNAVGGIEGEVHLPNGQPVPGVYLQLQPEGIGGLIQSASTDSDGHFTFGSLGAGANYMVILRVPGFLPVQKLVMVTGPETWVEITLFPARTTKPAPGGIVSVHEAAIPPAALAEYNKGLNSLDAGKTSDAEKAFRKAIAIYPQYSDSYLRLSAIYADQNQFSQAKKAIAEATKIQKDSPSAFAYLGYLYMKENQPQKAQQSFEKSIQMQPNDWFAQLELGRLLYSQKDYAGALPHFEQARKLDPGMASVHLMLYDDLIRLNRFKEALAELDDFVARFPKNPQTAAMKKVRPALAAAAAKQRPQRHP